jgi:hypothetical protein
MAHRLASYHYEDRPLTTAHEIYLQTEALLAKIIAALNDDWQRASDIVEKIHGGDLSDYDRAALRASMFYHLRNLSDRQRIECDRRMINSHRVNFYRRIPSQGDTR